MITIYDCNGKQIARSKNLRGILDRNRKATPVSVALCPLNGTEGQALVIWADGSYTWVRFASYCLMVGWFRARRQPWVLVECSYQSTPWANP